MVLYVFKYDIHPDKGDVYTQFVRRAIPVLLNAPGVVELRAYRPAAGAPQVVATWEFADMAAWAGWQSNADVQKTVAELLPLTLNLTNELWGPSPVVPAPLRPNP